MVGVFFPQRMVAAFKKCINVLTWLDKGYDVLPF
jgi:hypothetical protein